MGRRRRRGPGPRSPRVRRTAALVLAGRRARQPAGARARGERCRPRRSRRPLPVQRDRVPRGDARRVQDPRGARQRQLPVRRGGAALPARQLRRQGRGVPPRVRAEARRGARRAAAADDVPRGRRRLRCGRVAARCARLRGRARRRVTDARLRASVRRRPLHPVHRRHHRHAEGRDVAPRGHLLRCVRRGRPRQPRLDARGDRRPGPRRCEPRAPGVPVHARHRALDGVPDPLRGRRGRHRPGAPPRSRARLGARRARARDVPRHRRRRDGAAARRGHRPARPVRRPVGARAAPLRRRDPLPRRQARARGEAAHHVRRRRHRLVGGRRSGTDARHEGRRDRPRSRAS